MQFDQFRVDHLKPIEKVRPAGVANLGAELVKPLPSGFLKWADQSVFQRTHKDEQVIKPYSKY